MKITDITPYKGSVLQIDLEDADPLFIHRDIAADFHLAPGLELPEGAVEQIHIASQRRRAYERALYLLDVRAYGFAELFEKLERLIGKPLIAKERRTYALKNGLKLEVNDVDAGLPSHFMYAEVEYPDEPTARAWTPADDALTHYLSNECTGQPGASMGEYWTETRK